MNVLVTGANGFIGAHLVEDQLARGRRVCAVDLADTKLRSLAARYPGLEIIKADIRDRQALTNALKGQDIVFHLASAHLDVALPESDYLAINRDAARWLVEAAHRAGVARFVHCSSVGVHGEIHDPPANEESPCHPDLVYERTKLEGERAVRAYAEQTGYPVVIVRPVWVYGPGCPRTKKLFRTIEKGRFFYVGSGEALRHCLYIADMVEGFHLASDYQGSPGQVFILGDHRAVTIRELIETMARVAGVPAPRLTIPLGPMRWLCRVVERACLSIGKEPPISERSLKFFTNNTSFDISRAKTLLGFEPRITLEEGMRRTYAAIRAEKDTGAH